jgi:hypothetical protein
VARPDSNVRPAQADAEFVAECRLPDAPFAAALAVSVRREVARRAGVAPEAVQAADRLPEEWGVLFYFDAIEFVMELEEVRRVDPGPSDSGFRAGKRQRRGPGGGADPRRGRRLAAVAMVVSRRTAGILP